MQRVFRYKHSSNVLEQGDTREIPRPAEVRRDFGMTVFGKGLAMRDSKRFYVYIMTNRPRSHVLYTGMTGNLARRVFEHKNKLVPGFTSRYKLARLAYYESFAYPDAAIDRGCESAVAGLSGTVERRVQAGF